MRDIDELLPQVLPYAPRVPEPTAIRFIRECAIEICTVGKQWRVTDSFPVMDPESEGLCTEPDAAIISIEAASLDGQKLKPATIAWLDANVDAWESATVEEAGTAKYITQLTPNTVTVTPKATGMLSARFVLKPSLTATTLPDFLIDEHGIIIGKGAAGRILTMPRQDNPEEVVPQVGVGLLNEFNRFLDTLRTSASKGQQGAVRRSRATWF